MYTLFRLIGLLVFFVTLSGCASSPYYQEISYKPPTIEISDEQEKQNVSYLARYMMSRNSRRAFVAQLQAEERQRLASLKSWGDTGVEVAMATDVVTGELLNTTGQNLGSAMVGVGVGLELLDSVFSQMADFDQVSQGFLPAEVNGEAILTAERASQVMMGQVQMRLERFAAEKGFHLSCIGGCTADMRYYQLRSATPETLATYHYNPATDDRLQQLGNRDLFAVINLSRMRPTEQDPLRDRALGFTPAWETPTGNTFVVRLFAGAKTGADGEPLVYRNEAGVLDMSVGRNLVATQLGREFFSTLFDGDLGAYYFDNDIYPHTGYFRGKVYTWVLENERQFITSYLDLTPPRFKP
ncbi:MAG: hypothetical protein HQL48_10735 [Gammaproteobacteria bacterium]|nr:hypothetical protein [Gammaproteobacteria bacterium]